MPLNRQKSLNGAMPANAAAKLGDIIFDLIDANNALATKYNALVAKLDLDAGVTDTNYAALTGGAAQVITLELR